jgi:hypothetical protein
MRERRGEGGAVRGRGGSSRRMERYRERRCACGCAMVDVMAIARREIDRMYFL